MGSPSAGTGCTSSPRCRGTSITPSSRSGGVGLVRTRAARLGAASPGCTRSRPTSATSRRARSGSPASPVSPASAALAHAAPTRRGPRDVAAAADRSRRSRRCPAAAGAVRLQHPRRLPRRGDRARPPHRPSRHHGGVVGSSASATRHADAVTVLSDDLRDNVETSWRSGTAPTDDRGRGHPQLRRHRAHHARWPHDNAYRREHGLGGKHRRDVCRQRRPLAVARAWCSTAARALRDRDDVGVRGERRRLGPRRPARPTAADLPNVRFVDVPTARSDCARCWPRPTSTWCRSSAAWPRRASRRSSTRSSPPAGRCWLGRSGYRSRSHDPACRCGGVRPARRRGALHRGAAFADRRADDRDAMGASGRRFVEGWVSPAGRGQPLRRPSHCYRRGPAPAAVVRFRRPLTWRRGHGPIRLSPYGQSLFGQKARRAARAGSASKGRDRREMGFPLVVALVILLGTSLVIYARSTRSDAVAPKLNVGAAGVDRRPLARGPRHLQL